MSRFDERTGSGDLSANWLVRRLQADKRGESGAAETKTGPRNIPTLFAGHTVNWAETRWREYKAPHHSPTFASIWSKSCRHPMWQLCLTRPIHGSTPCTPRSRRLFQSARPGPLVMRVSSSDRATIESTSVCLPARSVPIRVFAQLLVQKLLHAFVRLTQETVSCMTGRRFI